MRYVPSLRLCEISLVSQTFKRSGNKASVEYDPQTYVTQRNCRMLPINIVMRWSIPYGIAQLIMPCATNLPILVILMLHNNILIGAIAHQLGGLFINIGLSNIRASVISR